MGKYCQSLKMFKVSLLVALIACSAIAYRVPSVQQGADQSVVWTPQGIHVLHTGTQVGRSVTKQFKFDKAFPAYPQVLLANWLLDWQDNAPAGYSVEVVSISQNDFTVKWTALSARQLYSVFISYLAFDDPTVQVGYVFSDQLGPLANGQGERKISLQIPFKWEGGLVKPAQVTGGHFLLGARFTRNNFVVYTHMRDVTPDNAIVDVIVLGNANVDFVRIGYIVGSPNSVFVSPVVPGLGAKTVPVNPAFSVAGRGQAWGLTGYDIEGSLNLRVRAESFTLTDGANQATANANTWSNTRLYGVDWRFVVYKPDPNNFIWDPKCAELFSECNYKGQTIVLCDRVNSFPKEGWSGPVKSFHLPPGGTLKLYDQENLNGKLVTFTESQTCVDNYKFSLLQRAELIQE